MFLTTKIIDKGWKYNKFNIEYKMYSKLFLKT